MNVVWKESKMCLNKKKINVWKFVFFCFFFFSSFTNFKSLKSINWKDEIHQIKNQYISKIEKILHFQFLKKKKRNQKLNAKKTNLKKKKIWFLEWGDGWRKIRQKTKNYLEIWTFVTVGICFAVGAAKSSIKSSNSFKSTRLLGGLAAFDFIDDPPDFPFPRSNNKLSKSSIFLIRFVFCVLEAQFQLICQNLFSKRCMMWRKRCMLYDDMLEWWINNVVQKI